MSDNETEDTVSSVIITLSQGKRIRYARETAGLDQTDIARAVRLAPSTISAWENDKNKKEVPYAFLRIVADLTGFPVEFFEGDQQSFATVPDGGSPLAGVGATSHIASVTPRYARRSQVAALRMAA